MALMLVVNTVVPRESSGGDWAANQSGASGKVLAPLTINDISLPIAIQR